MDFETSNFRTDSHLIKNNPGQPKTLETHKFFNIQLVSLLSRRWAVLSGSLTIAKFSKLTTTKFVEIWNFLSFKRLGS